MSFKHSKNLMYGYPDNSSYAVTHNTYTVKLGHNPKKGILLAQIGPTIYESPISEKESLISRIINSDQTFQKSFEVISANITVPRNGRGEKVIIRDTLPASSSDVEYFNDWLGTRLKLRETPGSCPDRRMPEEPSIRNEESFGYVEKRNNNGISQKEFESMSPRQAEEYIQGILERKYIAKGYEEQRWDDAIERSRSTSNFREELQDIRGRSKNNFSIRVIPKKRDYDY